MKIAEAGLGLADVELALKRFALKKSGSDVAGEAVPASLPVGCQKLQQGHDSLA